MNNKLIVLMICANLISGISAQDCVDNHPSCSTWISYCGNHPFMDQNCKRTCNDCPGGGGGGGGNSNCVDLDNRCQSWLSSCSHPYVFANCKKSCKLCSSGSSWSSCSKSCGEGTRSRTQNGQKEYEACNTQDCPMKLCRPRKSRYGMPHACCSDNGPDSCGKSKLVQRVHGGEDAIGRRWPWMVAINSTQDSTSNFFCAGVLISSRHVVTVGHCMADIGSGKALPTKDMRLNFGILRLSDQRSSRFTKRINKVFFPPLEPRDSDPDVVIRHPENDIALIKMVGGVQISSAIRPICLPGGEETPKDTKCFVTGWGITSNDPNAGANSHLQEVAVQNMDLDICRVEFAKRKDEIPKEEKYTRTSNKLLCAGSLHKGANSCRGDSGGPLMCQRCSNCNWYLAGIVSTGLVDCTEPVPGAYTKLKSFEDWILGITGEYKDGYRCTNDVGP